jgi:hypothetical protein
MDIPNRTNVTDYHFHQYNIPNLAAFTLSGPSAYGLQYYNLAADLQELAALAYQKGMSVTLWSSSRCSLWTAEGREIYALRFLGQGNSTNKPGVLITGGVHAREWIAVEVAYLIAEYLINNYPTPGGSAPTANQQAIKDLVDSRVIFIVPMMNPDGHSYTMNAYQRMWRVNRRPLDGVSDFTERETPYSFKQTINQNGATFANYDAMQYPPPPNQSPATKKISFEITDQNGTDKQYIGIDLNRNFTHSYWGYETYEKFSGVDHLTTSGTPGADTYFGPTASSEIESKILASIINSISINSKFCMSIDYHSFAQFLLFPDGASSSSRIRDMAAGFVATTAVLPTQVEYDAGETSELLYPAFASIMDFAYDNQRVGRQAAFTVELDPVRGTFEGFKLPENQIQGVFERNIRGALALIECAGASEPTFVGSKINWAFGRPIAAVFKKYQQWEVAGKGNNLP